MGLDIRIPIGFMFGIIGVVITIYGIITNGESSMYECSLNININLWSGIIMTIFGILMLLFSGFRKKTE